jgi:hypothetical protein
MRTLKVRAPLFGGCETVDLRKELASDADLKSLQEDPRFAVLVTESGQRTNCGCGGLFRAESN